MSDADVNHLSVLMEQVVDQNKAVLEAVGNIQRKVADLSRDLAEHKSLPAHLAHGHA